MLKKKKIRKKYIALLTATVVVGTVFCAALISFIRSGGASELWESPMGYLVLVLFAVLPVLLLVLLAATATGNPASDSYPLRKKEEEKVVEEETRFYKLNEIDGKREEYAKRRSTRA